MPCTAGTLPAGYWQVANVKSPHVLVPEGRPLFSLRTLLIATTLVAIVLGLGKLTFSHFSLEPQFSSAAARQT
jgi:hypothetical protein